MLNHLLMASLFVLASSIVLICRSAMNSKRLAPSEQNTKEAQDDDSKQKNRDKNIRDTNLFDPRREGEDEGGAESVPYNCHANQCITDDLFSVSAMVIDKNQTEDSHFHTSRSSTSAQRC